MRVKFSPELPKVLFQGALWCLMQGDDAHDGHLLFRICHGCKLHGFSPLRSLPPFAIPPNLFLASLMLKNIFNRKIALSGFSQMR